MPSIGTSRRWSSQVQMYKVEFSAQRGDAFDIGTFLVCAKSTEDAEALVSVTANCPPSATTFQTSRVKPSIYELARRDFRASQAHFSGNDNPGALHEIRASAKVFAYSESAAVRRFAKAIIEQESAGNSQQVKYVNDLDYEITRADQRIRPTRIQENSIYKETRFFAGGAGRPR